MKCKNGCSQNSPVVLKQVGGKLVGNGASIVSEYPLHMTNDYWKVKFIIQILDDTNPTIFLKWLVVLQQSWYRHISCVSRDGALRVTNVTLFLEMYKRSLLINSISESSLRHCPQKGQCCEGEGRTKEPFQGKKLDGHLWSLIGLGTQRKKSIYEGHHWDNWWNLNTDDIVTVFCRNSLLYLMIGLWLCDGVYVFLGNIHWNALRKSSQYIQLTVKRFRGRMETENHDRWLM